VVGTPAMCPAHNHSGSSRASGDHRRQEQRGAGLPRRVVLVNLQLSEGDKGLRALQRGGKSLLLP